MANMWGLGSILEIKINIRSLCIERINTTEGVNTCDVIKKMKLSNDQINLLESLSTDYQQGLPSSPSTHFDESEYNVIPSPINCPKWACIILPCINHIPSMKLYKVIQPTEAEVRKNERWIIYDAISVTKGDIVRLSDGDIVPADVVVLSLGMDFVHVPSKDSEEQTAAAAEKSFEEELIVDSSNVNGYANPQIISDVTNNFTTLYAGSMVLQGTCIAVVVKTGPDTLLANLIQKGKWPPKEQHVMNETGDIVSSLLVEESEVV